jgi:hypothetical protein
MKGILPVGQDAAVHFEGAVFAHDIDVGHVAAVHEALLRSKKMGGTQVLESPMLRILTFFRKIFRPKLF